MMQEAFRVIGPSGKTYRIYVDGRIEGFEKGSTIINRITQDMRGYHFSMANGSPFPIKDMVPTDGGASHFSASINTSCEEKMLTAPGEK
jgi:hypothetical protein